MLLQLGDLRAREREKGFYHRVYQPVIPVLTSKPNNIPVLCTYIEAYKLYTICVHVCIILRYITLQIYAYVRVHETVYYYRAAKPVACVCVCMCI